MNKEEIEIIKLEKISYEELQHEFINVSTENYVLEHQNNRLQQELNQKNKIIEKIKEYCKSYRCWEDEDGTWHESDFCIDDLLEIIEKGSEE